MAAIGIRGLSKSFDGFQALSELSLEVNQGEFLTLLGPSGCGKTTLLKIISGFLEPSTGSITIGGEDVTRIPPERRDTALCFQSYALFPHLTVLQNLEFGLKQKRVSRDQREVRISEVAAKLELEAQLEKLPKGHIGNMSNAFAVLFYDASFEKCSIYFWLYHAGQSDRSIKL